MEGQLAFVQSIEGRQQALARIANELNRDIRLIGADKFQRDIIQAGKDFEATKINSSLRAGEVGRRILGNGSSRPLAIVENIQSSLDEVTREGELEEITREANKPGGENLQFEIDKQLSEEKNNKNSLTI